jgi:ferredoxin
MLYSGRRQPDRSPADSEGGQSMRVRVDREACEANAVCAGLVPEVFEVGDDDSLRILLAEMPADLLATVRLAVRSCPKAALRLDE